jgi:hypothetical protein
MSRTRFLQLLPWASVVVLIIIATVASLNGYTGERSDKESAQATAVDEQGQKKAVVSEAEILAQQATAACAGASGKTLDTLKAAGLCRQADKTKDTIEKATNDDLKTPVVTGPSQAQVNAAVQSFLGRLDLTGEPGVDGAAGARGPAPTSTQIAAAVTAYCSTRDQCRGVAGVSGTNGTDGKDGKDGAAGDRGPAGTDGLPGANGTNGADGRGIASLVCSTTSAPITFNVTYTDGTSQEFSCGEVASTPDPTTEDIP